MNNLSLVCAYRSDRSIQKKCVWMGTMLKNDERLGRRSLMRLLDLHNNFYPNRTKGKCSKPKGKVRGEGAEFRGDVGEFRQKMQTSQISSQNEPSKYNHNWTMGKCSNRRANVWGERQGIQGKFRRKKFKCDKCHPKLNLCRKFHPNPTIGKCSKSGIIFGGKGGGNLKSDSGKVLKSGRGREVQGEIQEAEI